MVLPRFISKKERKLGCSNTEMEEKKGVGTMNQNGILESQQIGEKSESEGRFQEKEGNQLKKRKSWEIHNTKEGRKEKNLEKYNLENDEEKMEKHDLRKEQRWETEILAEDDLDIPARTEVVLMGRLKKKICGKILVCELEEMGNAHFLVAKSVVKNGESVPIRLINLSQGQVKVQRNQKIALATGCVEEEETEKESLRVQGVSLSDDKWIAEGFQMDHLTENTRKKLSKLLLNYRDLFREDDDELTSTTEVKHGIAARFEQLFGSVNTLMEQKKMVGEIAELRLSEKNVYYMVTKFRYYEKPSYRSVWNALRNLKKKCEENKDQYLAMPKIACGLDGLSWEKVQAMIEFIFQNSNLEVIVYEYLVERMVIGQIEKEDMLEPEWDRDVLRKAQEQDEFCKFVYVNKVLEDFHDSPLAGHQGQQKTLLNIKKIFYIINYCIKCDACNRRKTSPHMKKVPLQKFTPTQEPWELTSMDIIGPLVTSMNGNRYLLTFQDYFTKYPEVYQIKKLISSQERLWSRLLRIGIPERYGDEIGNFKEIGEDMDRSIRVIEKKGPVTYRIEKVGTREEQVIHVNRLKPYYGEVKDKLPEEIWTGWKNTREKSLKEKMEDEYEERLKERIRRKNRRNEEGKDPEWNPAVIPQGILIRREEEKNDSEEDESEGEADNESEEEFLEEPMLRRSTRIRNPPDRYSP
ncbi:hypothetical protein JTB14_016230 [Gonioctena quinquepunctata]|nr:hypothetical protein JTB14_016230 [Gonioctena quinquepunctata]